jgi:TRAP-type C4-dicarboxylate transport system permease small subunit
LVRRFLDALYRGCAVLGGVFLVALLVSICLQIAGGVFGFYLRGNDAYAGYFMAAAIFLALPYTLKAGDHIRVTLLLQRLEGTPARRAFELFCLVVAVLLSGYFAWYSIRQSWLSYEFNDISQADDQSPLWIPQLGMAVGTVMLFIAFLEALVDELLGRTPAATLQSDEPARVE